MRWYDELSLKQSNELSDLKSKLDNIDMMNQSREKLHNRIVNAGKFFEKEDITKSELERATALLKDITQQIGELDIAISSSCKEVVCMLEQSETGLNIVASKEGCLNSIDEESGKYEIDSTQVSPSQLYLLKVIKDVFNVSDNNIQFKNYDNKEL